MGKLYFILEEVWLLSTLGAFQRANIYLPLVSDNDKKTFRNDLNIYINENLIPFYKKGVDDKEHLINIQQLSVFSKKYDYILKGGKINFGISQKLLNLYLKYLWCLEQIPTPPHFPVDSIIQSKLGLKKIEPWTKFENPDDYLNIIAIAEKKRIELELQSLAQLELELFKRN
jgi:hypothetical protein